MVLSAVESHQTVALVGICVIFGVSLLVTIVFLALYARQRIKNYSNVRRRIIAIARPVTEVPLIVQEIDLQEPSPVPVIDYPEPVPVPPPAPQKVVVVQPPSPPPPPQPQPPPPAREPEVVVHEVIHRYEPAPAPPPPPPPSQERIVRRRLSWGCPHELDDDWILVKRAVKKQRNKTKAKKSKYESSSEEDSSDDEYRSKTKRRHKKRLDRYDLATNFIPIPIGIQQPAQPQLMSTASFVMAQPAAAAAPAMVPVTMLAPNTMVAPNTMLAPNTMVAQQACMPMFTTTR